MTAAVPAFGPTGGQLPCDENSTPFAAVTLSFEVTREQLRAALAIGQAENAGEPPLPDLTVHDTRREIEGYFAGAAVFGSDTELQAVDASLAPDYAADLDTVIDRAYTRPHHPAIPQTPLYRDGTVTLQTDDHGEIVLPEPAWCTGHDDDTIGTLADVTHNGRHVRAGSIGHRGYVDFLDAFITHAPYLAKRPEPYPVVSVNLDLNADLDPDGATRAAHGLRAAALRLERLAGEARRLRNGGHA
ncbi:hypothetical protein ABT275_03665 [Streptomyces sp. NPDC001185]|uniref:DUF6907 domain-containing protein n=1 Tax=Streptomyces sp. NPDC001185 TaxID=3154380 RepID=UPI003326EA5D